MESKEVVRVLEEELERLKKQSEYYSGKSYQVNSVGNVIEALSQAIELIKENEDLRSMWKTLNEMGKENVGIILLRQKTKIASLQQVLQRVDDVEGIKVILWKSFGDVYDDASYTHTAQALHSWLKGEK